MENQQPEALILANDRPSSTGDDLYQWALDAEDMIRRLHAHVEQLEAFAKEIEQYGILLRVGGAAPHDLKDRGAILEQYVKFNPRILEMDQQPETIKIASKLELADLLGRMGEAGERISRYADEVKIAGAACEAAWPTHANSESKP